ncbi:MAG TPA: TRAP transporter substrate-binding protein [Stellaceae bacterium]|nr:TRAP transporter substrate-binding protein [Stellaceae bacterium]
MKAFLIAAGLLAAVAQGAAAEETVLRFTPLAQSGTAGFDQFYKPWAEKVTAASQGALRIDIREGTSIANITNVYERVKGDVTHIGFTLFNYVAGKFPFAEVAALPFIADNSEQGSLALWRLYKTGIFDAEFDEVRPLMLVALPQSLLHLAKPPKSLDNLSGLRIIGPTQITSLSAKYLGMQPITLSSPEAYTAILRGTADGTILSWNPYFSFKIGEVTTYHVDAPLGTAAGMLFMSRKVFDGLSPEAKHALDVNSGEEASRAWGKWWDGDNDMSRASAKSDPKQTVVTLDPAMRAKWTEKLEGAVAEWSKSRPGIDTVIAEYRRLNAEMRAGR